MTDDAPVDPEDDLTPVSLGAGLTHEIRNALFALTSELEGALLELGVDPDSPVLRAAMDRNERTAALLDEFRALIEPRPLTLTRTDLNALLSNIAEPSRSPRSLVSPHEFPSTSIFAHCDDEQLAAAFRIFAAAAGDDEHPASISLRAEVTASSSVVARILFRGPGRTRHITKLWKPFVIAIPGGTKLSLARARRTLLAHGGRVSANDDGGLTIDVTLPLTGPSPMNRTRSIGAAAIGDAIEELPGTRLTRVSMPRAPR